MSANEPIYEATNNPGTTCGMCLCMMCENGPSHKNTCESCMTCTGRPKADESCYKCAE